METAQTGQNVFREYLSIATLAMVAVILRIPYLGRPLIGDEGGTFNKYGLLSWKTILFNYDDTNQHSLFSLLSNLCLWLFGESEIYFRLPSFTAGVLTVPLLYCLSRSLNNSAAISFLASILLIFSEPHLSYSQEGRGYALTVFLAVLLVLATTKLILEKDSLVWGLLLILSGLCMVITIPSNVVFLAVAGVYCLATKWFEKKRTLIDRKLLFIALVFLILLVLTVTYLGIIYVQLKGFSDSWGNVMKPSLSLLLQTGTFLTSPWSPWLWVFFIVGCFGLRSKNSVVLFTSVFVVPTFFMLAAQIGGVARTYIYFLPFILILVAIGIVNSINYSRRLSPLLGNCLFAVVATAAIFESAGHLTKYYSSRSQISNTLMAEARQVYSYVQTEIQHDQLISLARPTDDVLNHYLQRRIQDDGISIITSGKTPGKIIFINRNDLPPWSYPVSGDSGTLTLPRGFVKQIKTIGNIQINELDASLSRFIPPDYDPDYEATLFDNYDSSSLKIEKPETQNAVGKKSLVFFNKAGEVLLVNSDMIKSVDIKEEGSYLLLAYLRKWDQMSDVFLLDQNLTSLLESNYAILTPTGKNYRTAADRNAFEFPGSDVKWGMVFVLYPIKAGHHDLVETFNLINRTSYFDAIQSFIISK